MNEENRKVPRRIAQTVLNSLKGGVVPRVGLPYITVGRKSEIEALLHDVDILEEGGASFRFIVGRYGSGKSFLIQTIRNYVMDRGFIVADADLSPERRLQGTRGQGLATYRELISNLSTKTKPEGGALTLVLDRWISGVQSQALQETGLEPGSPALTQAVDQKIVAVTSAVSELVHGFEFAKLLSLYYHAYVEGEEEKKQQVARWFRGEYATKREAKEELGVNILITDDNWYEYLKLFAVFFRLAGYAPGRRGQAPGRLQLRGPALPPGGGEVLPPRRPGLAGPCHPPGAPHPRGDAGPLRKALRHARGALRLPALPLHPGAGGLYQAGVRPHRRGPEHHPPGGHPGLYRAFGPALPEPLPHFGGADGVRGVHLRQKPGRLR